LTFIWLLGLLFFCGFLFSLALATLPHSQLGFLVLNAHSPFSLAAFALHFFAFVTCLRVSLAVTISGAALFQSPTAKAGIPLQIFSESFLSFQPNNFFSRGVLLPLSPFFQRLLFFRYGLTSFVPTDSSFPPCDVFPPSKMMDGRA